jgi:hypothetical protein
LLEAMLRVLAEVGPGATWIMVFLAAIIAVFALYVGIALLATLRAVDDKQQEICHQVLRDLLDLFRRRHRP